MVYYKDAWKVKKKRTFKNEAWEDKEMVLSIPSQLLPVQLGFTSKSIVAIQYRSLPIEIVERCKAMNNDTPETISLMLLNIKQVCQLLNISRTKYYELKDAGKIGPQPVVLCRKILYRKDEMENWVKAGLPNKDLWRIIMKNEQDYKNNVNININNFNGVLGNVQSENLQNESNTNCHNYKDSKDVLKNRNIFQPLFAFIKKSIGLLGLIKPFILKLLFTKIN